LAQARARRKARAADEALRESEARYREILETTNEGVWRLDAAGVTDYVNPEMASLLGYDVSEMTGQPLASFMDSIAFESAAAADPGVVEQEFRHKDGSVRLMRVSHKRLSGAAGEHAGSLAMLSDVTQARASEIALEASEKLLAAVTDSMAEGIIALDAKGCFTYLNRAAERMLGWTQAEVSGLTMHDTIHYQREDGTANPVDQSPLTGVRKEGRRVRVDDDVFVRKNDQPLAVSYSSSPILIGNDANQGAVVVFSDATASRAETRRIRNELESLSWVGRIRDALAEDRFVLYAQPIIDLRSGETTSHELLLRMLNREGAVVNPGAFLPSAERFDVIQEIDRWVIGQAARLTARGHSVHFNLSAKSLSDPELIPFITSILAETNADPSLMVCEITETALMKQPDGAEAFTHALTALGCRLALDDFGTGYGGFTYLKRLPISYLKIDIEFVRDLLSNSQNQHVVKAIVALATGFGKQTVAEGVEDELTLTQLTDHGVNGAQGYVIGRPAPAREVFSATAPHQW
jgi:PAS domain S-box-containing protein